MKTRGLGVLLVLSGVTLGALPAFAPVTTNITVHNNSTNHTPPVIFQKPPEVVSQPKAAAKPVKAAPKPVEHP